MISQITDLILFKFMYASDYSKNLITVEEKVAELMKQRDQLRAQVERLRSDRDCEKRLRKDADEFRENAIERAERAEAELANYKIN